MSDSPWICTLLVIGGLVLAGGGIAVLIRGANSRVSSNSDARRPYLPLATTAVGLVIAYRAYSDCGTLDGQDIAIMFLFVLGLVSLIGLQFFVVDKNQQMLDPGDKTDKKE